METQGLNPANLARIEKYVASIHVVIPQKFQL